MDKETFRKEAHKMVDWMADYLEGVEKYPVRSRVKPGEIYDQMPENAPEFPIPFEKTFEDFNQILMPGITHWQHPMFMAYFNANTSYPSILGEMLTATLGAQCMIWDTSPAAAELEQRVCEWMRDLLALPKDFTGVIQDTASTSTLCALLTAREKYSDYAINRKGFGSMHKFRIYCSEHAHSSIEKAVKIAGFGQENLVKIECDEKFSMKTAELEKAIHGDLADGLKPLMVVAALGTTSTLALDPVEEIGEICKHFKIWLHVDAAYAGTAAVLPEYRWIHKSMEYADSYVANPHKWMFTNFDCSLYYVRDQESLIRTFEILPEYLKTKNTDRVNNYRDWGIQLGRRFRALKLWMVLNTYGAEGIRRLYRKHIEITEVFTEKLQRNKDFRIMAPVFLNLVCFRYQPEGMNEDDADAMNARILDAINSSGHAYLSHTRLHGRYVIRACFGQTRVEWHHMERLYEELISVSGLECESPEIK
ncbi:MAG: aminotransferase class V-fold PLP-dependent enzyme [Cyclobacteriaceae bacterium]|nr:aminotransferase class V-fold PLP-dependent enzyme [Cyclobacteriaceae bacterium]